MIRVLDAVLLTGAIAGAIYTFQIKHEAELSAKRLATLKAQIAAQDRKIALLQADWALETAPGRLEKIAKRYSEQLMLRAMESTQIIEVHELPDLRPPPSLEVDERLAEDPKALTTGGIEKLIERAIDN
ncbi:MAG: cell division protein FtsL [Rhizobiaceae bacterium]